MSIATPPGWSLFQVPPFPVRRFTVAEYHHMIQTGMLAEDEPVELLEGWIVPKMPRNPPHDGTIQAADKVIGRHLPAGWDTRIQSAITLADSEPEPDLTVVKGDERTYFTRHPGPQDIGLLIEVADTWLTHDRGDKGRAYARAGIVIYWIINLLDRQVEVYSDSTGPDPAPHYRQRQDYGANDAVPLVLLGHHSASIAVSSLLP
jgi:Uma2 family endonuclease